MKTIRFYAAFLSAWCRETLIKPTKLYRTFLFREFINQPAVLASAIVVAVAPFGDIPLGSVYLLILALVLAVIFFAHRDYFKNKEQYAEKPKTRERDHEDFYLGEGIQQLHYPKRR